MSLRTTAIVWEQSTAEGTELLLMLAIADIANDNGEGYPSVGKLARRCRIKTDRGMQKVIKKRIEAGELVVEPRFFQSDDGSNKQTSNLYSLLFRGLDNPHALKKYRGEHADGGGVSSGTGGERPSGRGRGVLAGTGEQSLNDSLKQSLERRGYAATPEPHIQIIEVWVKGWDGDVSGNPYSNKTYRADAKKLAEKTSLTDIKRYTLAYKAGKWANARPSWGIWFNDLGVWLAAHPAPNGSEPEPDKKSFEELPDAVKKAAGQKLGSKTT